MNSPPPFFVPMSDGVGLRLRVQPNSSKNQIVGLHGDALKVKVKAPPEDGRANQQLIELFAELLSLPKRDIHIVAGQTSRSKTIKLDKISIEFVATKLRSYL